MAHVWEPWLQCQSVILKYLYLAYKKHPDQHYLRMPAKKKKLNMPSGIGQNHVFLSSKPRQDGSQDANLPFSQHAGFPSESCSVMSDSLQPHWLYSPWNSPDQNTGIGSLSLLQEIFPEIKPRSKVIILCPNNWSLNLLACHAVSSISLDLE